MARMNAALMTYDSYDQPVNSISAWNAYGEELADQVSNHTGDTQNTNLDPVGYKVQYSYYAAWQLRKRKKAEHLDGLAWAVLVRLIIQVYDASLGQSNLAGKVF